MKIRANEPSRSRNQACFVLQIQLNCITNTIYILAKIETLKKQEVCAQLVNINVYKTFKHCIVLTKGENCDILMLIISQPTTIKESFWSLNSWRNQGTYNRFYLKESFI